MNGVCKPCSGTVACKDSNKKCAINVCVDCIDDTHCAPKICNSGMCVECVPGNATCGTGK